MLTIIDVFIPGEYLSDLSYPALPDLHPEHLVLHLELQLGLEGLGPVSSTGAYWDGLLTGEGLVNLSRRIFLSPENTIFPPTLGQVGTSSSARSVLLNLSCIPRLKHLLLCWRSLLSPLSYLLLLLSTSDMEKLALELLRKM